MSINNKITATYAKSLFQNVQKSKKSVDSFLPDVFIVEEELVLLRAILISSEKLNKVFQNPTHSEQQKLNILLNVFPGLTITTKSFLKVLTERSHLSLIPEISDNYTKLILQFKNTVKVKLITASPLESKIGKNLLETLKTVTKSSEIILNTAYNPKLLGGIVLEYNSVAIDASILKEFSLFFTET